MADEKPENDESWPPLVQREGLPPFVQNEDSSHLIASDIHAQQRRPMHPALYMNNPPLPPLSDVSPVRSSASPPTQGAYTAVIVPQEQPPQPPHSHVWPGPGGLPATPLGAPNSGPAGATGSSFLA